jgi:hypothetical protein
MAERSLSVEKIPAQELPRCREFMVKARYHNYAFLSEVPEAALAELVLQELAEMKEPAPVILAAKAAGETIGMVSLQRLNWDTEHFGIPMARIKHILGGVDPELDLAAKKMLIAAGTEELRRSGVKHVAVRLSADDAHSIFALQQAGYYLADSMAEYYFNYRKTTVPQVAHTCEMKLFDPNDLELVKRSSKTIFKNYLGRFHSDPNLDREKADQLYEKWIINSCTGLADDCILALMNGKLAGITSVKMQRGPNAVLPLKLGEVALVGVVPECRGLKVCTSLISYAQKYFDGKIDQLQYATQVNNFYVHGILVKLGFLMKYAFHTFHYYMPGG